MCWGHRSVPDIVPVRWARSAVAGASNCARPSVLSDEIAAAIPAGYSQPAARSPPVNFLVWRRGASSGEAAASRGLNSPPFAGRASVELLGPCLLWPAAPSNSGGPRPQPFAVGASDVLPDYCSAHAASLSNLRFAGFHALRFRGQARAVRVATPLPWLCDCRHAHVPEWHIQPRQFPFRLNLEIV